ncbi:hypothetical protein [Streptomyces mirabilis]|uniref:hypothetical protein n=1 Tax=Streptomyces mirabilis TaxID=68239 RepID=UPI003681D7ED
MTHDEELHAADLIAERLLRSVRARTSTSEDIDTWDGEASRLWTKWDDGTGGGHIELTDLLALAGLRLSPRH